MKALSLAGRNLKEVFREIAVIPLSIGQPVALMLLFHFFSKSDPAAPDIFRLDMLVPGIILFSLCFITLFSALFLARDRQSAFLTRLLAAPLNSSDFILAYVIPYILIATLQIAACFIIGLVLGMPFNTGIFVSFIIFIPLAVICISLGMVLGSLFSENVAPPIGSITIMVITLLAGVWMDLQMVGGWFERIAYILPFAHALNAARTLIVGTAVSSVGSGLVWLLGYMIAFVFLGILSFHWKTKP